MTDNDDLGTLAGIRRMTEEARKPKVIDLLTFAGEGPVPCVRKSDYDAVCAMLREAHDQLDYHYSAELRSMICKALGETPNEWGQLLRTTTSETVSDTPPDQPDESNG